MCFQLLGIVSGLLTGCVGGQSGDSNASAASAECTVSVEAPECCSAAKLGPDDVIRDPDGIAAEVTPRQLVEQRALSTAAAYWLDPAVIEPEGGFEADAALRTGQASVALVLDEDRAAFRCDGNVQVPVVASVVLDDGFEHSFDATWVQTLSGLASRLTAPNGVNAAPTAVDFPWADVGACSPYFRYSGEIPVGQLCMEDRWVRWPSACGGDVQSPLDVVAVDNLPSARSLLDRAANRVLHHPELPSISLALSSVDPTVCGTLEGYKFMVEVVAETAGARASASALAEVRTSFLSGIRLSLGSEFCFDLSTSTEWTAIAAREGGNHELCVDPGYALEPDGQVRAFAEVHMSNAPTGWVFE